MNTRKAVPFKWPFPPAGKEKAPARRNSNKQGAVPSSFSRNRKGMLADVVMVVFWGASIPGLMWLGAACGF